MNPGMLLLEGVVGSKAYGLADEFSDEDRLGIYAEYTVRFHGLHPPTGKNASHVTRDPDTAYHEAGKFVALALKANPTITELLWLDRYTLMTDLGRDLIAIRTRLLSTKTVRDSYLGYATQQLRRLESRGDGSFSSDTRKRTQKHGRHLWRLIYQGCRLHLSGHLSVRLSPADAESCRNFGKSIADAPILGREAIAGAEDVFNQPGALPEKPDEHAAEEWLLKVRREFYS